MPPGRVLDNQDAAICSMLYLATPTGYEHDCTKFTLSCHIGCNRVTMTCEARRTANGKKSLVLHSMAR
jgi:hypothetical protein